MAIRQTPPLLRVTHRPRRSNVCEVIPPSRRKATPAPLSLPHISWHEFGSCLILRFSFPSLLDSTPPTVPPFDSIKHPQTLVSSCIHHLDTRHILHCFPHQSIPSPPARNPPGVFSTASPPRHCHHNTPSVLQHLRLESPSCAADEMVKRMRPSAAVAERPHFKIQYSPPKQYFPFATKLAANGLVNGESPSYICSEIEDRARKAPCEDEDDLVQQRPQLKKLKRTIGQHVDIGVKMAPITTAVITVAEHYDAAVVGKADLIIRMSAAESIAAKRIADLEASLSACQNSAAQAQVEASNRLAELESVAEAKFAEWVSQSDTKCSKITAAAALKIGERDSAIASRDMTINGMTLRETQLLAQVEQLSRRVEELTLEGQAVMNERNQAVASRAETMSRLQQAEMESKADVDMEEPSMPLKIGNDDGGNVLPASGISDEMNIENDVGLARLMQLEFDLQSEQEHSKDLEEKVHAEKKMSRILEGELEQAYALVDQGHSAIRELEAMHARDIASLEESLAECEGEVETLKRRQVQVDQPVAVDSPLLRDFRRQIDEKKKIVAATEEKIAKRKQQNANANSRARAEQRLEASRSKQRNKPSGVKKQQAASTARAAPMTESKTKRIVNAKTQNAITAAADEERSAKKKQLEEADAADLMEAVDLKDKFEPVKSRREVPSHLVHEDDENIDLFPRPIAQNITQSIDVDREVDPVIESNQNSLPVETSSSFYQAGFDTDPWAGMNAYYDQREAQAKLDALKKANSAAVDDSGYMSDADQPTPARFGRSQPPEHISSNCYQPEALTEAFEGKDGILKRLEGVDMSEDNSLGDSDMDSLNTSTSSNSTNLTSVGSTSLLEAAENSIAASALRMKEDERARDEAGKNTMQFAGGREQAANRSRAGGLRSFETL
ncbi:unnamed protein product [Zymoseptoria tritici ST99CH_3D1]|nr:unnamed protein product [Zymoseptoria tritici ST99CH_3D1]